MLKYLSSGKFNQNIRKRRKKNKKTQETAETNQKKSEKEKILETFYHTSFNTELDEKIFHFFSSLVAVVVEIFQLSEKFKSEKCEEIYSMIK